MFVATAGAHLARTGIRHLMCGCCAHFRLPCRTLTSLDQNCDQALTRLVSVEYAPRPTGASRGTTPETPRPAVTADGARPAEPQLIAARRAGSES
jgi:hypothetical protein